MVLADVLVAGWVALCLVVGLWLAVPALRALRRPGFDPVSTSDSDVFWAQQSFNITNGA